jgi:hypothetical protein
MRQIVCKYVNEDHSEHEDNSDLHPPITMCVSQEVVVRVSMIAGVGSAALNVMFV